MTTDYNKLRRQNGIIAGVCGGLAAFTGIHVFFWRLLFLFLLIPGGLPGFLPYILLWIVIPKERCSSQVPARPQIESQSGRQAR